MPGARAGWAPSSLAYLTACSACSRIDDERMVQPLALFRDRAAAGRIVDALMHHDWLRPALPAPFVLHPIDSQ